MNADFVYCKVSLVNLIRIFLKPTGKCDCDSQSALRHSEQWEGIEALTRTIKIRIITTRGRAKY